MGKIIKDSNGKVLMNSNGGAYEVTAAIDSNIVPNNIKKDVEILGVTGTLEVHVEAPENDVNFYDYDGFRVASYTIAEAKALTALPTPPTHEGLTFQEWNWTLADIQGYNRRYADIGANYIPTDGATHFKVVIPDNDLDSKMQINGVDGTLVVDWGDDTTDSHTFTSEERYTYNHTYAQGGRYDIKFTFTQSSSSGYWNPHNKNISSSWSGNLNIYEIWCGNYFNITKQYAIAYCGKISLSITKNTESVMLNTLSTQIRQINYPRNVSLGFSSVNTPAGTNKFSFPKSVVSLSASNIFGSNILQRLVIPEWTDGSSLNDNMIRSSTYMTLLSLPLCTKFTSGSLLLTNIYNLRNIEIVQGWTPTTSLGLNGSNFITAANMVDFFNKLGTTTNAITLTFGTTNLGKLTTEEKAIATNKGYTLA